MAESRGPIIKAKRRRDGALVQLSASGERPFPPDRTDWRALRARTDADIDAAADSDNPPRPTDPAKRRRVPQVKVMRRALRLTQEQFSARFRIPLGTLRDWEQGKSEPDQAARAYLTVIARNPDAVREALGTAA